MKSENIFGDASPKMILFIFVTIVSIVPTSKLRNRLGVLGTELHVYLPLFLNLKLFSNKTYLTSMYNTHTIIVCLYIDYYVLDCSKFIIGITITL